MIFLIRIRKQLANITHRSSSKDRVGDRMQQYIGIAMAIKRKLKRNVDATDKSSIVTA